MRKVLGISCGAFADKITYRCGDFAERLWNKSAASAPQKKICIHKNKIRSLQYNKTLKKWKLYLCLIL
jgi:hypothetical protein